MDVSGGESGEPCEVSPKTMKTGEASGGETNDSEDNKLANGEEPSLTNESKDDIPTEIYQKDAPVVVNGDKETGSTDVDQSSVSTSVNENEKVVDQMQSGEDTANGKASEISSSVEKTSESNGTSGKDIKDSEPIMDNQETKDESNFNKNCSESEAGTSNQADLHNGSITEKPVKQKKKDSPSKSVTKKVSIDPGALFSMPDFPKEKDHSKKPEEQFMVLIKTNDNKHLKQYLRSHHWAVGHPIRNCLWLQTCKFVFKWSTSIFQEMVDDIFKGEKRETLPLPAFVDPTHTPHYYLTPTGVYNVHLILIVLENLNPDITFAPTLFPIAALFLHFMEPEECFNCLYGMVRSRESQYIAQTRVAVEATQLVMRDLAKHHADHHRYLTMCEQRGHHANTVSAQCQHGVGDMFLKKSAYTSIFKDTDGNVEPVFRNWAWWIFKDLPFPVLVQVMDCYLYEGVKVFYRVALAVLILYHKHTSKSKGDSCSLPGVNVSSRIKHFCADIPFNVEKILKTAFGIRGLGKKEVRKLQMRHEMCEKSHKVRMTRASSIARSTSRGSFSGPVKSRSLSIPAPLSLKRSHSKSDQVSQDLVDGHVTQSTSDHGLHPVRSRSLSHLYVDEVTCYTLNHKDLMTIWGWLPARYTVSQPHLLYTSEEHGISLRTLYSRIDHNEPTLFVIKTTKNDIFGAFCSTDWRERIQIGQQKNLSYFGTGETFIFTLSPRKMVYAWVGLGGGQVSATASMFLAGDNHTLIVGGGSGTAIHLTDGLLRCRTEKCDTFNNPPLCLTQDFACKVVEVFGFS